jgi:hypothetical protein
LLDHFQARDYLRQEKDSLSIDFNDAPDKDNIWGAYNAEFCDKAIQTFSHLADATAVFKDIAIAGFINKMKSKPGLKKTILDFLDHENDIQTRQSIFLDEFFSAVRAWQHAPQSYFIRVCETSPYAFLKRPVPEV